MKKFNHIMKDTASSAIRNELKSQDKLILSGVIVDGEKKLTPSKARSRYSPTRGGARQSPLKQSMSLLNLQPLENSFNLDQPLKSTNGLDDDMTLEGISGMVQLQNESQFHTLPAESTNPFEDNQNISPFQGDRKVDVSIDNLEFEQINKTNNMQTIIQASSRDKALKPKIDFEISSIIGNINSRLQRLNPVKQESQNRESTITDNTEDQLKDINMELSEDIDPSERHSNVLPPNLDQTIIIGEMEEGNIFGDINLNQEQAGENTITMTKQDL